MKRLIALCAALFLIPAISFADAGAGGWMGYVLGEDYKITDSTKLKIRSNGSLVVVADNPFKPADIAEVTLVVTPETKTIGHISASQWFATEEEGREFARRYINILRAKYSDWVFGREQMNSNLRIDEVNLDKPPYNIKFRLDHTKHQGELMWRYSMTLNWLPDSKESRAWVNMSNNQRVSAELADQELLLEGTDLRGL